MTAALEVPGMLAACVSLISCFCFARGFRRLPRKTHLLMHLQIYDLACADIVASLGSLASRFVMFALQSHSVPQAWGPGLCYAQDYVSFGVFVAGSQASLLIEAQFTLGMLAACFHWRRVFAGLRRTLVATWLVAIALAIVDIYLEPSQFDGSDKLRWKGTKVHYDCLVSSRFHNWTEKYSAPVLAPCMLTCVFAFNLLAYLSMLMLHTTTPEPVKVWVRWQTLRFMACFLITWTPWMVSNILSSASIPLISSGDAIQSVTASAIALNGAANVLCYAYGGRLFFRDAAKPATDELVSSLCTRQLEENIIERYFDLGAAEDSIILEANTAVVEDIARARTIQSMEQIMKSGSVLSGGTIKSGKCTNAV